MKLLLNILLLLAASSSWGLGKEDNFKIKVSAKQASSNQITQSKKDKLTTKGIDQALTFNEAARILQKHDSVEVVLGKSRATAEEAKLKGSWGDPKFKIATDNLPKDSLNTNQYLKPGIEFSLSQKISLTTKYGNLKKASRLLSKAYEYEAKDKRASLTKALWEILIIKRKIVEEIKILKENQVWISNILKISRKLYVNGKISQQAILDIQIRKSEIESEISNKSFELDQLNDKVNYLIGSSRIKDSSIPWKILIKRSSKGIDNKEMILKKKLRAKELNLTASKLNYVPDLTVSAGIVKRFNRDKVDNFVGASISFPLPFSNEKYSKHGKAVQEKYMAVKIYKDYKNSKTRDISVLEKEIKKLLAEINILNNKTITFAENSRLITSKSYGLSRSSYVELLQSELALQKILTHKVMLEAKRDIKRVSLKYILGEPLYE